MPMWLRMIALIGAVLIAWTLVGSLVWWFIVRGAPQCAAALQDLFASRRR